MAVPTIITPVTPEVQAFMDRKLQEWTARDVRGAYDRAKARGSYRALIPVEAVRRLLEAAGA